MNTTDKDELPKVTFKGLILAFLIGCVMLAVIAEIALRVFNPNWNEFHSGRFMRATDVPGFGRVATGVPGFDGFFAQNNGDFRAHIHINDFGLRNDQPVSAANGAVWAIGDSMTFGWGVERNQYFGAVLAQDTGLKVYNLASPGTDPCGYQALFARMPKDVKPSAVVVGLVLENDMLSEPCADVWARDTGQKAPAPDKLSMIKIKTFLTGHLALYNFFTVTLKRVDVVRVILTKIGVIKAPQTYRISVDAATVDESAARSADALLSLKKLLPEGTPMVVLVAPGRFEINGGDKLYHDLRERMMALLAERGIDAVDPFEGFAKAGFEATHFLHDGHWSAQGHKIAGDALAAWFKNKGLAPQ